MVLKKNKEICFSFLLVGAVFYTPMVLAIIRMTTAFNEDVFPLYSAQCNRYLLDKTFSFFKDDEYTYEKKRDHLQLYISPFGVSADRGKTITGIRPVDRTVDSFGDDSTTTEKEVPLGDLKGRTNLIALLYGATPNGQALSPVLQEAKEVIFGSVLDANGDITDGRFIDPQENVGCESIYLKYTKKAVRFGLDARFNKDFGGSIGTGVASVKQTFQRLVDKTKYPDEGAQPFNPEINNDDQFKNNVQKYLADEVSTILDELDLVLADDTSRTSIEDIRVSLFWRHVFEFLPENDEWPDVLLIPYIEAIGSVSPGAKRRSSIVYDPVFGNNQHAAIGFNSGIYLDFVETIYFGTEFGYVHFLRHDFSDMPVPTSEFQKNIYPFRTDISVRPGANWHFAFKIGCDHFIDKVSMYFEYVMMEHKKDNVELKNEDPAFLPAFIEQDSAFKAKLCNIGFSYDVTPNTSIGFLWQAPITQRNAYKATTVMLSLQALL